MMKQISIVALCSIFLVSCVPASPERILHSRTTGNVPYTYTGSRTQDVWTYQNNKVELTRVVPGGLSDYELRINDETQEVAPCFFLVNGPILSVEDVMGYPAVTLYHDCLYSETDPQSTTDILYKGDLLSQKLEVDEVSEVFSIESLLGYVVEKNSKEYVVYNNVVVSSMYDSIVTQSCCTSPSYFVVTSEGIEFLAIEEGQESIVQLPLK